RQLRWRQLTPPEYDGADAAARQEIEMNGVFSPYEKEFIRKNGSQISVLIGGVSTHKEPPETLCLALDLSERKRAEERMRGLVECGKILAASLDCEKTFPEVAEFIAANVADSCLIFVNEQENLLRMAAAHRAPIVTGNDVDPGDIRHVLSHGKTEMTGTPISRVLVPI